ncbi:MAG: response regulator, partial [Bacteroidales bacterium]|nr:response regulator [Bacteroidales bacterium]
EKSNLEVLWAQNGQECVDLFSQNPTVSLILMDMQMPVMDGMEAASIILKNDPKVPIIFQTAFEFDDERRKVMSLGCAEFINKPIDRILLYQKISQVIR